MKKITLIISLLTTAIFSQQLRVDSVAVDSVWNSDSSWYDGQGIFQQRQSRDCYVSFIPIGEGMAQCYIALSLDGGNTWAPTPNPLVVLDNGISNPIQCGTKGRVKVRTFGGDRDNVVFKIIGRQNRLVISGDPKIVIMGLAETLIPGNACGVTLNIKLETVGAWSLSTLVEKVYWDELGDGSWNDSTNVPWWAWQTTVPQGASGQRRSVIVKARDINGLWSLPCTLTVQFGLKKSLTMVSIAGGSYQMGDASYISCTPLHSVTVNGFKMSANEITQDLYTVVMGTNPSSFRGDTSALRPVESVSWYDAVLFCNALSKLFGKDTVYSYTGFSVGSNVVTTFAKNGYRLPTEAEWEYAYRAGTTTNHYWSDLWDTTTANNYCWSYYNSKNMTHSVGGKLPNAWGLYDMAGNVWEWCNDCYGNYTSESQIDPTGETAGSHRVLRGGSWHNSRYTRYYRAGYRSSDTPLNRGFDVGFRVVCR